jgi:SPX domain protein involved in polyphosphate accumulation
MKFEKRFFFGVIPEWKDKYLDYTGLCAQIKLIKKAALNLAKAYANIRGMLTNTTLNSIS